MTTEEEVEDFLEHFGVKGMKWGQRKDRAPGVSAQVDRHARKDAHEFARAKAFFGEGAGTRRKLIKQTVDAKTKNIPGYKKAFDHHVARQDMAAHVSKAISERTRTDRKTRNKQRGGAIARRLTGEMGTQAAFVAVIAGGAAFATSPRGRQVMQTGISKLGTASNLLKQKRGAAKIADFLRNSA